MWEMQIVYFLSPMASWEHFTSWWWLWGKKPFFSLLFLMTDTKRAKGPGTDYQGTLVLAWLALTGLGVTLGEIPQLLSVFFSLCEMRVLDYDLWSPSHSSIPWCFAQDTGTVTVTLRLWREHTGQYAQTRKLPGLGLLDRDGLAMTQW